jgi:hypothetical protein
MAGLTSSTRSAEDAIEKAVWKLEALSDIFSVLSSIQDDTLHGDSFYGVSQIMRDELDVVKRNVESLSACRGSISN